MEISKKIAILGSHAVGKTSLISRFVEQKFPEKYLTTIGLKVDKKTVKLEDYTVDLVIWDIAGQDEMDGGARNPQQFDEPDEDALEEMAKLLGEDDDSEDEA